MRFGDLYNMGSLSHKKAIQRNYSELQSSDPINIQYTSVLKKKNLRA